MILFHSFVSSMCFCFGQKCVYENAFAAWLYVDSTFLLLCAAQTFRLQTKWPDHHFLNPMCIRCQITSIISRRNKVCCVISIQKYLSWLTTQPVSSIWCLVAARKCCYHISLVSPWGSQGFFTYRLSLYYQSLNNDLPCVWPCFSFTFPRSIIFGVQCIRLMAIKCAHACMQVVLCRPVNTLCVYFLVASDSEDDGKLLCACKNEKGTCVNGTCNGDICFYSWVQEREERGCFSANHYREQCLTSFPRFFVSCCKENLCNAFTTPPPNISQYLIPLLYNILENFCCIEPSCLV